jgi:hypothetical protein
MKIALLGLERVFALGSGPVLAHVMGPSAAGLGVPPSLRVTVAAHIAMEGQADASAV